MNPAGVASNPAARWIDGNWRAEGSIVEVRDQRMQWWPRRPGSRRGRRFAPPDGRDAGGRAGGGSGR